MRHARPARRSRPGVAVLIAALLLGGCTLVGGGEEQRSSDPDWLYDEEAERYVARDSVQDLDGPVREHFPSLGEVGTVVFVEGQFTDPHERFPFPAQDDYWWQSVTELEPEQVDTLIAQTLATGASDLGGADAPETLPESQVRALMVGPLESEIEDCDGDRIDVTPALTESGYANRSAAGDMIELAVVCEGGTQLVSSARDM